MKTAIEIVLLFAVLMAAAEAGRFHRHREQDREERSFKRLSKRCLAPMDLVLVLDSSDELAPVNVTWEDVQGHAKKLIDRFNDISDSGTHVGVMRFGALPVVDIKLDTYKGAKLNAGNITAHIDRLKLLGGKSFLDKALAKANSMFTEASGMRKGVPKVCVLITPGIQTPLDSDTSSELPMASELLKKAKPLKNKGVQVFSLGIGDDMDVMNLIVMATTSDNVIGANYMSDLVDKIKEIKEANC